MGIDPSYKKKGLTASAASPLLSSAISPSHLGGAGLGAGGSESGRGSSAVLDPIRVLLLLATFALGACLVYLCWLSLPQQQAPGGVAQNMDFQLPPRGVEDAKALGRYLGQYTDRYMLNVVFVYLVTYVFLQTFAIPGSIFLSIIAGALFPFPLALLLVCLSAAIGASNASILSNYIGRGMVEYFFPRRVQDWRMTVYKQRDNLFNYMIFLRITPLIPNWLINIASPIVGFPLSTFFWGTFLGVGIPSLLFVNMGRTLQQLTAEEARLPMSTLFWLFCFGIVSLVPVLAKEKLRKRFEA